MCQFISELEGDIGKLEELQTRKTQQLQDLFLAVQKEDSFAKFFVQVTLNCLEHLRADFFQPKSTPRKTKKDKSKRSGIEEDLKERYEQSFCFFVPLLFWPTLSERNLVKLLVAF